MGGAPPPQETSFDFVVSYPSALVRVYFHIFFGAIFLLVAFTGDACCAARVKLKLLRGDKVKVTHMTGWLSNFDPYKACLALRSLPVGWIGLIMIAVNLLTWTNEISVAALVQDQDVKTRCSFGTGLIVDRNPSPENFETSVSLGAPALMVRQAQLTSVQNYGLQGVYKKAKDFSKFSAAPEDLIGWWQCERRAQILTLPFNVTVDQATNTIKDSKLLYTPVAPWPPPSCWSNYGSIPGTNETGWAHLVILESSVGPNGTGPFNVRATVDMLGRSTDTKEFHTFECKANSDALHAILSIIQSYETLFRWCPLLQGSIYSGRYSDAVKDTMKALERHLNSFTMVAGGNNYMLNTTEPDETLGCLVRRTTIHWVVVGLAGATAALLLTLFGYLLILFLQMRQFKHESTDEGLRTYRTYVEQGTPEGVLGWIAHAIHEARASHTKLDESKTVSLVRKCRLKYWEFAPIGSAGKNRPGIRLNIEPEHFQHDTSPRSSRLSLDNHERAQLCKHMPFAQSYVPDYEKKEHAESG